MSAQAMLRGSAAASPRSSFECPRPALSSPSLPSCTLGSKLSTLRVRGAPTRMARQQHSTLAAPCRAASSSPYSSFSSWSSMDSGDESDGEGPHFPVGKLWVGGVVDYYSVLQVDDDATTEEVKKAYRALAKQCHPDFLEAYDVLSDAARRTKYNARLEQALKDDQDDYTGKPLSKWVPSVKPSMAKHTDPNENRAVFVDEAACIGCKQCVWHACATFRIEPEHGRSRVYAQWLDTEEHLQAAIDSCPVSCIHWVEREQLAPLEYVMQKRMTSRTNVGIMMSGQGGSSADVWSATQSFLKERRRLQEAQEAASRQRGYSPAQEEARRAATSALRRKSLGVFAHIGDMMDNFAAQLQQTVQGVPENMVQVGKRKRAVRWNQAPQRTVGTPDQGYHLVPPERALVHVAVRSEY